MGLRSVRSKLGHVGLPRYYGNYGEALAPARGWVALALAGRVFVVLGAPLDVCDGRWGAPYGRGGGGGSEGG